MNKIAKKIFKSLLLSSFVSLVHNNAKADDAIMPGLDFNPNNDDEVSKVKNHITKNVIKISPTGRMYEVKEHRSHSSHRSHTSSRSGHSSHYSSTHYSSSHSSHYSSTTSGSTTSGRVSSAYTAPKTPGDYSIGDRTIKQGTYGADVDKLVELLIKKFFLKPGQYKKKSGYYIYDATIAAAVRNLQRQAGITISGNADKTTTGALQSWNENITKIELGFRDLANGDFGTDVNELVTLLTDAGFPPNPAKTEKKAGNYVFNEEIITALKIFQAYNGLAVSGSLDSKTIAKLKTFKKK